MDFYDVILYGSDQIWRKQPGLNAYNPVYFANNSFKTNKHIAFSASMGVLPTTEDEREYVRHLLSHFDTISVRERDLKDLLVSMGYETTIQTLDPTLLIPSDIWKSYFPGNDYYGNKYVLIYALNEAFDIDAIKTFAQNRGLEVKIIRGTANHYDTSEIITTAGPLEFMGLIQNAECVFSSSFHGLAFSLVFNKDVFVSFKSNSSRVKSLLSALGISSRFLEPMSDIPLAVEPIDYKIVNNKLSALREISINYLKSI